jgi:exodeoxyribonuclease V alpha subunit
MDIHKIFANYFDGAEGLAYALSAKLADGHICLDIESYAQELSSTENEIDIYQPEVANFKSQCSEGKHVTHNPSVLKPFVVYNDSVYLQRYFVYETLIIDNLRRIANNNHLKIVTGGPGTGKTYSVAKELIQLFGENPHIKVALAAPTGKAAVRVNESIKQFAEKPENNIDERMKKMLVTLKAQTIHRLLGAQKDSVFFRYNEKKRLPYDLVIIDECSMIDGALMAKLLSAVPDKALVYMLGDKDQLASVEAGSVFGDICRAHESVILKNNIEFKNQSFRFDANKGIGKFSQEVIKATFNDIKSYQNDAQISIDTLYEENLFKQYALGYLDYIQEPDIKMALKKINTVRFLCLTRENKNSVHETNKRIETLLKKEINNTAQFSPSEGFYHNQPIIVTRNNYELGVFNGDVGLIRKVDEKFFAHFESNDGSIKKIQAGYLNDYQTVFAMTIHKSQGSEFEHVVVVLPEKAAGKLLTRELLYTAVTRAKTKVLLQTSEETLKTCIETEVLRSSGLKQRLLKL